MSVVINDLCLLNKALEDDILHIQQCQPGINPIEEKEMIDPEPLLDAIWESLISKNFKLHSLAKFDGWNDLCEYVASTNT